MVRPTAVWSLDHTASSTLSIAKDVIRAATTDNVQALALVACEKFGATLAMCPETNKKIEDLIIKASGPKLVKFMSAQIGYSANDCATQLSQSLAGVQFLGLAAALVSSVGIFQGANALSVLLMASASDKTLIPTVRQLKDLLWALEHRVNRSGFTDIWVGYQILLIRSLGASHGQHDLPSGRIHGEMIDFMTYPATEGISKLVEAFRELDRLGNVIAITIHASSCAPWVMAFTRWCLGIPPFTYLPNGKALLDQVDSRITLFTSQRSNSSTFEISIQRSVGSPAELVQSRSTLQSPFGMISLEGFGRMWCQKMGGEGSDTYRAVSAALPYALKQVHGLLEPESHSVVRKGSESEYDLEQLPRLTSTYRVENRAQPFPKESTISNTLTRVLNLESQQNLMSLSEGHLISDLPLLRACLGRLEETCNCNLCQPLNGKPKNSREIRCYGEYDKDCKLKVFLDGISVYVADILALSLYENPGTLLVLLVRNDFLDRSAYVGAIRSIITTGKSTTCGTEDVIDWALGLVGHESTTHKVEGQAGDWVISCSKGQAVYPKVFETRNICQPGYLVLYWAPGLLFFNGEKYNRGISTTIIYDEDQVPDVDEALQHHSVIGPLNVKPNMKLELKVTCCDGYLEILLVCEKAFRRPLDILVNLGSSLILRGCPHDSASPLERPDQFASYKSPIDPVIELEMASHQLGLPSEIDREQIVGVVAVDGNSGLRMFAMTSARNRRGSATTEFVIRENSCLQCCLDLCRRIGCPVLIC
ncbi:hypothetical protein BDR22DRAFT_814340 [Usnea florida]